MHSLLDDFDLFIFDWDGTLSTSTALVRVSHFFKRRYNPQYIRRHLDEFRQPKRIDAQFNAEQARAADFAYTIYTFFVRPRLREGAIEVLETLKRKNKKVALFSDGARQRVENEVRNLGVEKYFDFIVSAQTLNAYKPNPTGIEAAIREASIRKARSLYLGDMAIDIFTARFAKVKCCAIGNGLDPYDKLVACKPDYIFQSTHALLKSLGKEK
ncbi:MAG: HAD-IA family hydrolase [Candidatus Micrarchaeota archaeon]|nr:HAD-IA family hydrolase [Candidatus Micrarchaeota archaeon]MDE1847831.1 HAD-IA family hydrolase [Candidatus Micrarchaeota archaeon]MDE1864363.1 HAD-IA family hydrolase [Candidatus Micrarchaeota archaeon]